jgi:hypothetical protein
MPVLPGLSEAAPDALIARMTANLALLNARLNLDGRTPVSTVLAAQIYLGDPDTLPASLANPVWFAVVGGASDSAVELEPEMVTFGDNHPYSNPYFATITAYAHPQHLFGTEPHTAEAIRHRALSRMADWLRADVFNTQDALIIPLASQEYSAGTTFDQLKCGSLRRARRADAMKGVGRNIAVPCIRFDFEGVIR